MEAHVRRGVEDRLCRSASLLRIPHTFNIRPLFALNQSADKRRDLDLIGRLPILWPKKISGELNHGVSARVSLPVSTHNLPSDGAGDACSKAEQELMERDTDEENIFVEFVRGLGAWLGNEKLGVNAVGRVV